MNKDDDKAELEEKKDDDKAKLEEEEEVQHDRTIVYMCKQ